jgi:hypothetical protein
MSERLTEERLADIARLLPHESLWEVRKAWLGELLADRAAQQAEITRLVARVGELEAALRIYANPDNWFSGFEWDYTTPTSERNDGHEVAAQALANGEKAR